MNKTTNNNKSEKLIIKTPLSDEINNGGQRTIDGIGTCVYAKDIATDNIIIENNKRTDVFSIPGADFADLDRARTYMYILDTDPHKVQRIRIKNGNSNRNIMGNITARITDIGIINCTCFPFFRYIQSEFTISPMLIGFNIQSFKYEGLAFSLEPRVYELTAENAVNLISESLECVLNWKFKIIQID